MVGTLKRYSYFEPGRRTLEQANLEVNSDRPPKIDTAQLSCRKNSEISNPAFSGIESFEEFFFDEATTA